ncbi:methionine adenosyltransferase [Actinorugispora endophytica]|uniref:Methionine adenosyltransferase n=1 Tax=Actinorugispora endophytica TaxID=1605990 RepID=A0A4R6V629_9ACTN|nr:methionine adenosyltransferase [Actinorugispora endophytica]TDQ54441.1 methionine adenosyltransferase [Actinorugispora endophytica]
MRTTLSSGLNLSRPDLGFNVVERKGIGHPDSLADLIAEEFSRRYSLLGVDRFGAVPNHWVDKVALVGAEAVVGFGRYTIHKPVSVYLFGKVTPSVGGEVIPVEELFRTVVEDVLHSATGSSPLLRHLRTRVENTAGVGADHPVSFYRPDTAADCVIPQASAHANDTAFCSAYAPADPLDLLAIDLENHINGPAFSTLFPAVGSDVKVMLTRAETVLDATVCLPVHPKAISSHSQYADVVTQAKQRIDAFISGHSTVRRHHWKTSLTLNSKDRGRSAYLAPFGTSLGKGDCGLVGRGNKANGVISANYGSGVEALAGKNPIHHTGKLYTLVAARIADQVFTRLGLPNETVLVSRNGDRLTEPSFVGVRLAQSVALRERQSIEEITGACLSELHLLSQKLLTVRPIDRFRTPSLVLEV